jgi:hypothetical protein
MQVHQASLRTGIVGIVLGSLAAVVVQFAGLPNAPAIESSVTSASNATSKRCVRASRQSDDLCQCAAKIVDSRSGSELFASMAFGGRPPPELVPEGIDKPREVFAEDVRRLEADVIEVCSREIAEDQASRPAWTKQCLTAENSQQTCDCFYDGMKQRLSGEGWQRFRRIIANDLATLVDGLSPNARGDAAQGTQLEVATAIPIVKMQCGLKGYND